jgi:hypothetical protein
LKECLAQDRRVWEIIKTANRNRHVTSEWRELTVFKIDNAYLSFVQEAIIRMQIAVNESEVLLIVNFVY